MLAWVLLVANMPTIVCTICSAFLAYKERPQWVWFAGLAVLAGIGGLLTLGVVPPTARMAVVNERRLDGQLIRGARSVSRQVRP